MKIGVYLNIFLGRADLVYYNGKKLELADHLTFDDLNVLIEVKEDITRLVFKDLEYLGDL